MKEKLNEEFIHKLSEKKKEPAWMLEHRLNAYHNFLMQEEPNFGPDIHINFDEIYYLRLSKEQVRLLEWLVKKEMLPDIIIEIFEGYEFEEI